MAHLVDSSVWVALFIDSDANHTKAAALLKSLKGKILVPYCVINETATVLAYKHSKHQADTFLGFLQESSNVILFADQIEDEVDYYQSHATRISFTDSALVYLAKHLSADLVTFDKQQATFSKKK